MDGSPYQRPKQFFLGTQFHAVTVASENFVFNSFNHSNWCKQTNFTESIDRASRSSGKRSTAQQGFSQGVLFPMLTPPLEAQISLSDGYRIRGKHGQSISPLLFGSQAEILAKFGFNLSKMVHLPLHLNVFAIPQMASIRFFQFRVGYTCAANVRDRPPTKISTLTVLSVYLRHNHVPESLIQTLQRFRNWFMAKKRTDRSKCAHTIVIAIQYPPLLRGRISACCLTSFFLNSCG